MDESLKRRLVGAVVLVALAVIAIPMLVGQRPGADGGRLDVDLPPGELAPFDSQLLSDEIPGPETVIIAPATLVKPFQEKAAASVDGVTPPGKAAAEPRPVEPPPGSTTAPKPVAEPSPRPAPDPRLTAWVIQVGSFSRLENAQDLVRRLRQAGLDTMEPEPAKVSGKTVYRVQVGPEADRRRAEQLVAKIRKVADLTGTVMSYP